MTKGLVCLRKVGKVDNSALADIKDGVEWGGGRLGKPKLEAIARAQAKVDRGLKQGVGFLEWKAFDCEKCKGWIQSVKRNLRKEMTPPGGDCQGKFHRGR